jgi:hypothetical protein
MIPLILVLVCLILLDIIMVHSLFCQLKPTVEVELMQTMELVVKDTFIRFTTVGSPPETCEGCREKGAWCKISAGYSALQCPYPDEANNSPSEILCLSIGSSYCL